MLQHTARLRGSHVSSGKSRLGTAQPLPKGERLSERSHRLLLYRHFTNYCPHQDGWGNYLITSINRFAPSFRRVSVTENPFPALPARKNFSNLRSLNRETPGTKCPPQGDRKSVV